MPVYLQPSDTSERALCLFQYPLRPQWRPYQLDSVSEAQIRPQQRRVEIKLPIEQSSSSYDAESVHQLEHIGLTSTLVSATASYAIGMLRRGEDGEPLAIQLTPLDHSVQLRPSFAHVDASAAKDGGTARGEASAEAAGSDEEEPMDVEEEAAPAAAKRAAGPVFRPAQTEKEIEARRSSHAYLMQQLEQEPGVKAQLHTPGSDASGMARERLFGE